MNWALITGGSAGIGLCYASLLAEKGYSIIIVSHQEALNIDAINMIKENYAVNALYLTIDLATSSSAHHVFNFCKTHQLTVDVLVNNAGMFFFNTLVNTPLELSEKMLQLHVTTPSLLCVLFGKEMKMAKKGYILNVSSICASMTYPTIAIYGSTKRYLMSFSRAIAFELKEDNVKVCVLFPGAVDTDLYKLSPNFRKKLCRLKLMQSPMQVAKKGINALFKGRKTCQTSFLNYFIYLLVFIVPDFIIDIIKRKIFKRYFS